MSVLKIDVSLQSRRLLELCNLFEARRFHWRRSSENETRTDFVGNFHDAGVHTHCPVLPRPRGVILADASAGFRRKNHRLVHSQRYFRSSYRRRVVQRALGDGAPRSSSERRNYGYGSDHQRNAIRMGYRLRALVLCVPCFGRETLRPGCGYRRQRNRPQRGNVQAGEPTRCSPGPMP
jgi:hypothetical protein